MMRNLLSVLAFLLGNWQAPAIASSILSVADDTGTIITLAQPARRIVALAPHITEMLYAAGGAGHIVGAVSFSDYPPAALTLPQVGDSSRLDLERIVALKPDLIVAWMQGDAARKLAPLHNLGIAIYYNDPRRLEDIPKSIERLGHLMGTDAQAQAVAAQTRLQLEKLGNRYRHRSSVRVFYQVWNQPLYTLNDKTITSEVIRLCSGKNVFGGLAMPAPVVNIEAVITANPDAIFAGDSGSRTNAALEGWKPFGSIAAVRHGNLFQVNADLLTRATPRIVAGATDMCEKIEVARKRTINAFVR